jgi:nicotinamidase-related amidase
LIDVINDLEFSSGANCSTRAAEAETLAALKRGRSGGRPVIYVNDNFGRWQSDFNKLLKHCLEEDVCGSPRRLLKPDEDDYFVLKPKHSGLLLHHARHAARIPASQNPHPHRAHRRHLRLFTANDAYMRDFHLVIPSDCVASADATRTGTRSNTCGACSRPTRGLRPKSTSTN